MGTITQTLRRVGAVALFAPKNRTGVSPIRFKEAVNKPSYPPAEWLTDQLLASYTTLAQVTGKRNFAHYFLGEWFKTCDYYKTLPPQERPAIAALLDSMLAQCKANHYTRDKTIMNLYTSALGELYFHAKEFVRAKPLLEESLEFSKQHPKHFQPSYQHALSAKLKNCLKTDS